MYLLTLLRALVRVNPPIDQWAKHIFQYKNTKEKLYKTNTVILFNKVCKYRQLTPNYTSIKIKGNNPQCWKTIRAANLHHPNQELKLLYVKKQKLNEQLYKLHLECAIFLAKQFAPHSVTNRLHITTSNGNTLHPSQQESGPSTRKTTKTDQNSTQPRKNNNSTQELRKKI
jgi:hypothetical protein